MRRLALLTAASLTFAAIPHSVKADIGSIEQSNQQNQQCNDACYDKIAEKYGRPWAYHELAPADQRSWMKCTEKCDKDYPRDCEGRSRRCLLD